jgi:parallel beta-helix repeat protein
VNGIEIKLSSNNNISNNIISSNGDHGIRLSSSSSNIITNNTITSNEVFGIYLAITSSTNITKNNLIDDGIYIVGSELSDYNSHNIPANNLINGKPVYYIKNCTGLTFDGITMGELILANCSNINVKNLKINNSDVGIEIAYSTGTNISSNKIQNEIYGICLEFSSYNNITDNDISNTDEGIYIYSSSNNSITNNNISNSTSGIYLFLSSSDNTIKENRGSYCREGISIDYLSNHNLVEGNKVSNNNYGIEITQSLNNNITGNDIYSNIWNGIYVSSSSDNNITRNLISSNNGHGIRLSSSSNNRIYHNNIIDNDIQAYDNMNDNFWDNDYPQGGNYWSDYGGVDDFKGPDQDVPGGDGIGDTNYSIDPDSIDQYPLMSPLGNYLFLDQGWNLISIPTIQPDTALSSVFSSIPGLFNAVQWYNATDFSDHWKHNHTSKPSFINDLGSMDHKMGFWIHITKPGGVLFNYPGTKPTTNQTIPLYSGWNMVGYPSLSNKTRDTALNNLTFGSNVDSIWTYNGAVQKWEEVGDEDSFFPGKGYWIHATQKCVWEVPL